MDYETIRFSELSKEDQDALIAAAIAAEVRGDTTAYIWNSATYAWAHAPHSEYRQLVTIVRKRKG